VPLSPLQRGEAWLKEDLTPTDRLAETLEEIIREINDMTTNAKLFNIRPSGTGAVAQYTSPTAAQGGRGTVITKFSATGTGTYNVYIGDVADVTTLVINAEAATTDGTAPNTLIDQLVMPGDSIFLEPSAVDAIVFYASGTERR